MSVDMSSGLPDERDFIVAECPDVPMWSENLLFAVWDPDADVAMWLHLGTVPGKWTMWEDRVLVMLPRPRARCRCAGTTTPRRSDDLPDRAWSSVSASRGDGGT